MGWSGAWAGPSEVESQVMRAADEAAAIAWCIEKCGAGGSGFHSASGGEPDNALFADERAGPAIEAAVNEAFWQGVLGYAQDAFVQGPPAPWRFDVGAVAVPAHIIHGELDVAVPLAHSEHTARLLSGSTLHVLPGHGHMPTLSEFSAMISDLSRYRRMYSALAARTGVPCPNQRVHSSILCTAGCHPLGRLPRPLPSVNFHHN